MSLTAQSGSGLIAIAFLSSSYVHNLADKHGRRPLLIILPILATLATSSMIVACESCVYLHLTWLTGRHRAKYSMSISMAWTNDSVWHGSCWFSTECSYRPRLNPSLSLRYASRMLRVTNRGELFARTRDMLTYIRTRFYSLLEAVSLLGPGFAYSKFNPHNPS